MKNFPTVILLLCLFSFQSYSQDCKPYFPMAEGAIMEYSNFNKRGKLDNKVKHTVNSKEVDGENLSVSVEAVHTDKKGKETYRNEYNVRCEKGKFYFDMSKMIPEEQMAAYEGMDVEVDADKVEIPANPVEGTELEDGEVEVSVSNAGIAITTITVEVFNRKILKKESVTTEAGTFDCFVISQDVKTVMGKVIPVTVKSSSKEWYAPNVGIVKSESFNKKGKLTGTSELTLLKS